MAQSSVLFSLVTWDSLQWSSAWWHDTVFSGLLLGDMAQSSVLFSLVTLHSLQYSSAWWHGTVFSTLLLSDMAQSSVLFCLVTWHSLQWSSAKTSWILIRAAGTIPTNLPPRNNSYKPSNSRWFQQNEAWILHTFLFCSLNVCTFVKFAKIFLQCFEQHKMASAFPLSFLHWCCVARSSNDHAASRQLCKETVWPGVAMTMQLAGNCARKLCGQE